MRMRSLLAVALLAVSAGLPAWCVQNDPDQTKAVEGSNARPPATKQQALPPGRMNPRNLKAPKLPPPDPVKQLREFQALSPAEREKELAKLPPPRRERVERQLANFDAMTPEQREHQFHRLELMNGLTGERKDAVQDEIKRLRELRPRDRRDYLYSDEFKRKYSPEEQELIHGAFPKL
jgi:hypothetical protein